ncbi:hypothetical protein SteCoe_31736 [Stentor coeruleus]|uniref:G domain-containing protein n=1 Tax=Stentor coeruleus TaxID=5963 RepID=A0A1R2B0L2_9CILI|nr:hypothetical protein SteCoe_31736 [Stentor coeruleus]
MGCACPGDISSDEELANEDKKKNSPRNQKSHKEPANYVNALPNQGPKQFINDDHKKKEENHKANEVDEAEKVNKESETIKEDKKTLLNSDSNPEKNRKISEPKKNDIFLQKIEADYTILIIGEEASGKTSLCKLILNVIRNNSIENIEFNSLEDSDFISNYENCIMSEKYNLPEGGNSSSLTKGLRFYIEKEESSSKKLLFIDTPGIKITRNSELDVQYLKLINKAFKLKKIDYVLFVQKADCNSFSLSIDTTLRKLAENLKEYDFGIIILLTYYAGTILFKDNILPFNQSLIKKQYALNNQIFLIDKQTLQKKSQKYQNSYEISKTKVKKLIKLIIA